MDHKIKTDFKAPQSLHYWKWTDGREWERLTEDTSFVAGLSMRSQITADFDEDNCLEDGGAGSGWNLREKAVRA